MTQLILPAIIILIALGVIIFVMVKHFPQAAAVDLESLPAEKEAAMKAALMERRLKRKIQETQNKITPFFRKIGKSIKDWAQSLRQRVSHLEQRYRTKTHTMTTEQKEDVKGKVQQLIKRAEDQYNSEQFSDSEEAYIEVLSWDAKNLDAYFGLGEVYMAQKEFVKAKETFGYLLRLLDEEKISSFSKPLTEGQISEIYFDNAICLQVLEKLDEACEQIKIALQRDEKNPKYLDKLVELSILLKDKVEAAATLGKLKDVNPDNKKIDSFEKQIKELPT